MKAPDWTRAACRHYSGELFFPAAGQWAEEAAAKQVCASCPLRGECLEWALDTRQQFGIWGGLNEDERRREGRRRTVAA